MKNTSTCKQTSNEQDSKALGHIFEIS